MATNFLCHCDGTNGSTTFTDSAGSCTVTATGNAQVNTLISKFGGASAKFDGTSGHLAVANVPAYGTADFTFECFVYFNNNTASQVIFDFRGTPGGDLVYLNGASGITVLGGASIGGSQPSANTWHHIALVRNKGLATLYIDGVQSGSSSTDGVSYATGTAIIGESKDNGVILNGYIDEVRFSNTAIYLSNFTPPTSAFGGAAPSVPFIPRRSRVYLRR